MPPAPVIVAGIGLILFVVLFGVAVRREAGRQEDEAMATLAGTLEPRGWRRRPVAGLRARIADFRAVGEARNEIPEGLVCSVAVDGQSRRLCLFRQVAISGRRAGWYTAVLGELGTRSGAGLVVVDRGRGDRFGDRFAVAGPGRGASGCRHSPVGPGSQRRPGIAELQPPRRRRGHGVVAARWRSRLVAARMAARWRSRLVVARVVARWPPRNLSGGWGHVRAVQSGRRAKTARLRPMECLRLRNRKKFAG